MPPKKPKVVLTPDERKALRAEKKAQKKLLAEERKMALKHDHLGREIMYGALTLKRHEKKWRNMLIQIALPRMRIELEFAWHNFERVIDTKDFTISLLMDQIAEAEEQNQRNMRSHTENIDNLILLFREQIGGLKEENKRDETFLTGMAGNETDVITGNQEESEEFLKTMLYGLEMARKQLEIDRRGEMIGKLEDEIARNVDLLLKMKEELVKMFSDIWIEARHFLNDYYTKTHERRKLYHKLREQDDFMQKLLIEQLYKIQTFYRQLKQMREKFAKTQLLQTRKINDLLLERQFYADAFWTLRSKLESERSIDNHQLMQMAVTSAEITEFLRKIEKKGEHILELAAICRKLETQKEKVLPFPEDDVGGSSSSWSITQTIQTKVNLDDLRFFWRRVAESDASRYSINEEREFLLRENKHLLKKIHVFCDCLDCPAHSIPDVKHAGPINKIDLNIECVKYAMFNSGKVKN